MRNARSSRDTPKSRLRGTTDLDGTPDVRGIYTVFAGHPIVAGHQIFAGHPISAGLPTFAEHLITAGHGCSTNTDCGPYAVEVLFGYCLHSWYSIVPSPPPRSHPFALRASLFLIQPNIHKLYLSFRLIEFVFTYDIRRSAITGRETAVSCTELNRFASNHSVSNQRFRVKPFHLRQFRLQPIVSPHTVSPPTVSY